MIVNLTPNSLASAFSAFRAFKAFEATFLGSPSVWRYHVNPSSPNLCENCECFDIEVYELENYDELIDL